MDSFQHRVWHTVRLASISAILLIGSTTQVAAQQTPHPKPTSTAARPQATPHAAAQPGPIAQLPPALLQSLHWRGIGPFRGGRTRAVAGVPSQPNVFYIGVCNGGVCSGHTAIAEQQQCVGGEFDLLDCTEAARIHPDHAAFTDGDVRRTRQQNRGEFRPGVRVLMWFFHRCGKFRGGPPGRVPKTNEAHVTVPESETLPARSSRASALVRECERPALQRDHRTDRVAIGSDRARCARRCAARPWLRAA